MPEVWLKTNRHVLGVIAAAELVSLVVGLVLFALFFDSSPILAWAGFAVAVLSGLMVFTVFLAMRTPRLAYENGELLVYLQWLRPIAIPIDIVEVIFLGQGPTMPSAEGDSPTETKNAVVRLAEREKSWHQRTVRPELGSWCDGYIIIRGTWCEPLSAKLLNALNSRLVDIHRQRKSAQSAEHP